MRALTLEGLRSFSNCQREGRGIDPEASEKSMEAWRHLLLADLQAIVLEVWISVPVEQANALLNGGPALLWQGDRKFNHVGGLRITQLGGVTLISVDAQNIHRQEDVYAADLLRHLDDGNTGDEVDVVLLLEVLSDRDLVALGVGDTGATVIRVGKLALVRIFPPNFVDGILNRRRDVGSSDADLTERAEVFAEERVPPVLLGVLEARNELRWPAIEDLADSLRTLAILTDGKIEV